jgi:hypothetical protein
VLQQLQQVQVVQEQQAVSLDYQSLMLAAAVVELTELLVEQQGLVVQAAVVMVVTPHKMLRLELLTVAVAVVAVVKIITIQTAQQVVQELFT